MVKKIEWMCRNCGKTERRTESMGRPLPGHCIRMDGKPHSWVKNRILDDRMGNSDTGKSINEKMCFLQVLV